MAVVQRRCLTCKNVWFESEEISVCPNCSSSEIVVERENYPEDPAKLVNKSDWSLLKNITDAEGTGNE